MISNRDDSFLSLEQKKQQELKKAEITAQKEKKRKLIAYSIVGVISLIMTIMGIAFSGKEEKKENIQFETPESESVKYNNKLQAIEAKEKKQNDKNLLDVFSEEEVKKDTMKQYLEEQKLRQELEALNEQNKRKNKRKKKGNIRRDKTSNVYGDQNMWDDVDNKQPLKKQPKEIKKELTFKERLIKSRNTQKEEKQNDLESFSHVEFTAVINGNQTAFDNAMITVRVNEDVEYADKKLARNTFLYGVAKINKDTKRTNIMFSSMSINGRRIPINLKAYDELDGYEGLLIKDEETLAYLQDESNNELNTEISKQGKIGRIVSSVFRKKERNLKVSLYDEHAIIIKGKM